MNYWKDGETKERIKEQAFVALVSNSFRSLAYCRAGPTCAPSGGIGAISMPYTMSQVPSALRKLGRIEDHIRKL
jgi:hypothetical protein